MIINNLNNEMNYLKNEMNNLRNLLQKKELNYNKLKNEFNIIKKSTKPNIYNRRHTLPNIYEHNKIYDNNNILSKPYNCLEEQDNILLPNLITNY